MTDWGNNEQTDKVYFFIKGVLFICLYSGRLWCQAGPSSAGWMFSAVLAAYFQLAIIECNHSSHNNIPLHKKDLLGAFLCLHDAKCNKF